MRGRIKEDDSGVPTPDGPFAYLMEVPRGRAARADRPRRRATAATSRPSSTATRWPRHRLLQVRRPPAFARPSARSLERRPARLGVLHHPRPALATAARICRTPSTQTGGSVVWGRDSTFFFYVRLDDNHRPLQVFRHRLGTPQSDDVLVYEETDAGWFTHIEESASGRFCVIAGGDHETSEQLAARSRRMPRRDAAPGRAARERRALQRRRSRRRAVHPHQRRRRDRLPHRHRAARDAGPRALARADPASAGRLYPRRSSSMPAIWCGWSARTPCPRS